MPMAKVNPIGRVTALVACLVLIGAPIAASSQQVRYLSDEEALALEHQTRYSRLDRLAKSFGVKPEPEFRSYVIPSRFMPADFRYDIPVLRIIFPENTFFDTASSVVKPSAVPIIYAMAAMLDGDVPDVSVFIAGHADARGGAVYNHNLSVARAKAVSSVLNAARKNAGDVWTIGFGESVPLYPNTADNNMAWNRRVEFLLASRPDAIAYWLQDQVVDVCRTDNAPARLKCMLEFQKGEREFVAERVERVRVTQPKGPKTKIVSPDAGSARGVQTGGEKVRVAPEASNRIRIKLNEQRIRVQSIEN